jgi:predicted RNA-binding Zn-ribbon protein involved in translation (DUF1610 family)
MSETMSVTYQCEECGDEVAESAAKTETYPGHRETVTIAFCPDCTTEGRR